MESPALFRRWLLEQEASLAECVGHPNNRDSCPLANWLQETIGDDEICVRKARLVLHDEEEMALKGWMRHFVALVDGAKDGHITAARALYVLSVAEKLHFNLGAASREAFTPPAPMPVHG